MKSKVFLDLGFNSEQSLVLLLKSDLYLKLVETIKKQKIKPKDLELLLDIPQPRVSELLNGKISSVSLEKLIIYLDRLNIKTKINFQKSA